MEPADPEGPPPHGNALTKSVNAVAANRSPFRSFRLAAGQKCEQIQQSQGHFLGLIVGQLFAKLLQVNDLEFINGLSAELSRWCIHAVYLTGRRAGNKGGWT
jgi:hypothetical protein